MPGYQHTVRRRGAFQTSRQVDGHAHHGILELGLSANGNDARVNANANLKRREPPSLSKLLGVGLTFPDDLQTRADGASRVIFVSYGGAKDGFKAIAHEAGDVTAVDLNRGG